MINKSKYKLYIVPTPIGNIGDITIRAIKTLNYSDVILVESINNTKKLFNIFNISRKTIIVYNKINESQNLNKIINIIKRKKVSLICNSGTPGISDPGFLLINKCIDNNINIECLPGSNAIIPALIQSGASNNEFVFIGFLPKKKRIKKIKSLNKEKRTIIIYESPFRIKKLLQDLYNLLPSNRTITICREISKLFQENIKGTAEYLIQYFNEFPPKGEFVIVIDKENKCLIKNN